MKRLFYTILLTFIGITAFSQSPTKYANFSPAYPPVVGESTYSNLVFNHNGLYLHDIILDSLPHYEIEHIPNQTVRFHEDGMGFYVKADSLHSNNVLYNYEVDVPPIGPFEFNETTGRFKFYPDANDYTPFTVTFTATSGGNSITQVVNFEIMPEVAPEEYVIQSLGTMPSAQDYTIIVETHWDTTLNNTDRTVYSYSISGKDVVFDNNLQNKVWGLSGQENVYELNVFAERLFICSALVFPHTNVNIFARELIFEDSGNEIASINTSPSAIGTETNVTGLNGEDAGNITLHFKSFKADFAKRFILNGAKGQNANFNGTPGNGGNGGVLTAPINIENYCDFARGSAGVRFDTVGSVIGAGQAGAKGHFELITDRYGWVHPYYIAAIIRHITDAYLNDRFNYSLTTASDYYNLISEFEASDEWDNLDGTLKVELQDQELELQSLLYRLNENLDYFGNSPGWIPMLSFEVYMDNFYNEIDRSMPTMYLNYWLQQVGQTLAHKIEAARVAAEQTEDDIDATQDQINTLTEDIPRLEGRITILTGKIAKAQTNLEQLQAELMAKAKHNVEKQNRLNKAFGIATGVLNCIPVYGQIASAALTIGGSYFDLADTYGYGSAITSTFESIIGGNNKEKLENVSSTANEIKPGQNNTGQNNTGQNNTGQNNSGQNNSGQMQQLKANYTKFQKVVQPLTKSIINLQQTLAKSSAPNEQVQAEYNRLCSQSVEFKKLQVEINALQQSYKEIMAVYTQTMDKIISLTSEVSNEMVILDALLGDVFQGNSNLDLQAMQCVEKMKQRAMNRLVKYHYYMRKAYEYRLLRPYQGDFSLETLYNRIEALINQGQIIFDNSTPANFTDYSTLSAAFREEVSGIIEDVVDELTNNANENTASITIALPHEVLDVINANEEYTFNMFDLGLFSPDEDNIRIVGFDVQYIEAHTEGNTGMTTYMDINLEHGGISRFRKNGEVYWFNHISKSNLNPHPNSWRIRYNPTTQETTMVGPSYATESLLYTLLNMGGNATVNNIMLFSRPSAWGDIFMSKKVQTSGTADVVIDSLVLSLQYDFTDRTSSISYIDIATSDDLLAYITCSEADINGRSDGKGCFHRSYTSGNGMVTLTAMEKYGNYHFLNWTDRLGNLVSENTALTFNKSTHQFYKANYELRIPVLSVADTIFVSHEGGEYVVQIQNVGLGDIEMDWYVSDSLSTWVHLNGVAEGIDDGNFTFAYEPFSYQGTRIDSLEILAPEIEGMSKMIYIVQYDDTYMEVSASVEPAGYGSVAGTGFYHENDAVTLTALPIDTCFFVGWEYNGQMVSSQPQYALNVSGDMHYIAHFHQQSCSIVATANFVEGGTVSGAGKYIHGSNATLTATANDNYEFVNWTENGVLVSSNPVYSFEVASDRTLVANFMYLGNHWTPVENLYSNTTTIIGVVLIGGIEQCSDQLELGVFCGDECRGTSRLEEFYLTHRYLANVSVHGENGHELSFRLYDHYVGQELDLTPPGSVGFTDEGYGTFIEPYELNFTTSVTVSASVNPEGAGTVSGTGVFILGESCTLVATANAGYQFKNWTLNGNVVSTEPTFEFTVTGANSYVANFNRVHTQALNLGWSWWSTYIEQEGIDGLGMLENSIGVAGIRIQGRNSNVDQFEYQGESYWYGSLNAIVNEQMYKVRTNAICNSIIVGEEALFANHPITLNNGWNWIGFPSSQSLSVTNALSGFAPEPDDVIKGRNGSSTYIVYGNTAMWYGTLNTLEPGKGYMYKSNSSTPKYLTFQMGRGGDVLANITSENNVFVPNDTPFADNMTITAVINNDGVELRSDEYELAAFVDDECRGSVKLMYVEPIDRYVAFLTVFGEGNENVSFVLTNGTETQWSGDQLIYVSDATIGSLLEPAIIHFGVLGVNENEQVRASVYPNPSNDVFNIHCVGIRKIEVVNAFGQIIISKEIEANFQQVDLSNYAAGTYLLRVITDKGVVSKQLIKK